MKSVEEIKKELHLTNEQIYQISSMHAKRKTVRVISKETAISEDIIIECLKARDKEPIIDNKKEPAPSAKSASSHSVFSETAQGSAVSIYNYNKIKAECQHLTSALKLAHKGILSQYENMSNECQQAFDLGQLFAEIEQRMKEGGIEIDV